MSISRFLISIALVAMMTPMMVSAKERIIDTTQRKQPLKFWGAQFEELEYRYRKSDERLGVWDADFFYGTDEWKVRLLSNGEYAFESDAYEKLENQLVGQVPISTFFDAKAGLRFDNPEGHDRVYAVFGLAGLAPQWFEIDTNFYISDDGKTSVDLDAEYELLLTNYWIVTASLDTTVAFNEDKEIGVGKGLVSTELGLRLSYDLIDRSFSPYIGVVHERSYGDTADLLKSSGDDNGGWFAVVGARVFF